MLNCDMIGFQLFDYSRHFLICCSRLLGLETSPTQVKYYGRVIKVICNHSAIPPQLFEEQLRSDLVQEQLTALRAKFQGKKVIIGIDEMDYLQGISLKLLAFECFLQMNRPLQDKVVLIQVSIPHANTSDREPLRAEIRELVNRINSTFGQSPDGELPEPAENLTQFILDPEVPKASVIYIESTLTLAERCALLGLGDVLLITSCRDGLNVLPFQYVACKKGGALVVSEFTGCSRSLSGALRVNPWNFEEVSGAIHNALSMKESELLRKHEKHLTYVNRHTSSYWADRLSSELRSCIETDQGSFFSLGIGLDLKIGALGQEFSRLNVGSLTRSFEKSNHRLLLLNCDSLLQQFPGSLQCIKLLSEDPNNTIFLMSSHACDTIGNWFASFSKVGIVAEHGYYLRLPNEDEWIRCVEEIPESALQWLDHVQSVFQTYTEKTDGSFIEQKETSISWHYENADPDFGAYQAKDAYGHLEMTLSNSQTEILFENKKLEVKSQRCNKALAAEKIVEMFRESRPDDSQPAVILCIGGDQSDEGMFTLLHERKMTDALANTDIISCTLSTTPSKASYFITDTEDMMHLLSSLCDIPYELS